MTEINAVSANPFVSKVKETEAEVPAQASKPVQVSNKKPAAGDNIELQNGTKEKIEGDKVITEFTDPKTGRVTHEVVKNLDGKELYTNYFGYAEKAYVVGKDGNYSLSTDPVKLKTATKYDDHIETFSYKKTGNGILLLDDKGQASVQTKEELYEKKKVVYTYDDKGKAHKEVIKYPKHPDPITGEKR
jgi:hypothetical protein